MQILTNRNTIQLWQELVKNAEEGCRIVLKEPLESYLIALLMRYINQPEVVDKIQAVEFLKAHQQRHEVREAALQRVGDECLLFTGLFPHIAQKRHVKPQYFVDLGRAAYASISKTTTDLYAKLAVEFVALMDILQSLGPHHAALLPLEAYEQWSELGSKRAKQVLESYSCQGVPILLAISAKKGFSD